MTKKSFSVATALESHRISSEVPFLALLEITIVDPDTGSDVAVHRVAHNTEDVDFLGNTFSKGKFDIKLTEEAGKAGDVSLSVTDYTRGLQAQMEQWGGGVGSRVRFWVVNAAAMSVEAVENFEITTAQSANYVHNFGLGAENALTQSFPGRRQTRMFCQSRYKGPLCRYTGALATCDLTLSGPNGCVVHNNASRFAGCPGLNSNGYRYF